MHIFTCIIVKYDGAITYRLALVMVRLDRFMGNTSEIIYTYMYAVSKERFSQQKILMKSALAAVYIFIRLAH